MATSRADASVRSRQGATRSSTASLGGFLVVASGCDVGGVEHLAVALAAVSLLLVWLGWELPRFASGDGGEVVEHLRPVGAAATRVRAPSLA